jgi:hypothetical protein
MGTSLLIGGVIGTVVGSAALLGWRQQRAKRRAEDAVTDLQLPDPALRQLRRALPGCSPAELDEVQAGLRSYFRLIQRSGAVKRGFVLGMPSRAVDEAWHAFILETRAYAEFCQAAFGGMLHHTGFANGSTEAFEALYNTWAWGQHLPLAHASNGPVMRLFTLDERLGIDAPFAPNLPGLQRRFAERQAARSGDTTDYGTGSSGGGCGIACAEGGGDGGSDSGGDNGGDGGGCGGGGD